MLGKYPLTERLNGFVRAGLFHWEQTYNLTGSGSGSFKGDDGFYGLGAEWRLNEAWCHWLKTGRPWVIAKAACSLDGKIATAGGESQWLTGPAARAYGHRLRHRVDAILVGIETALTDDPQLTTRLPRGRGQDPVRVVLDSRLRLPASRGRRLLRDNAPREPSRAGPRLPA